MTRPPSDWSAAWAEAWAERAAILEHDAGMPRPRAERHAWAEVQGRRAAGEPEPPVYDPPGHIP